MKLRGIGFDLDSTLVDSLDCTARWIAEVATKVNGREVSEDEVREHFGKAEREIFLDLVPLESVDAAYAQYQKILTYRIEEIRMFPQIREALELIHRKKFPLGLYTTRGRWTTEKILSHFGIYEWFTAILAGDEVSKVKPDREGVVELCRLLKVKPVEFAYIGDSDTDVLSARNAGAIGFQALWADGVEPFDGQHLATVEDLKRLIRSEGALELAS